MNYSEMFWNMKEVPFNNYFNDILNETFKNNNIPLFIKKNEIKWGIGKPDGIGYIEDVRKLIVEYKKIGTYKGKTIQSAACQEVCYVYDEYKNSIIPIRLHVIITENEILLINNEKYEYIYENFALLREQYPDISPCNFYKTVKEARDLFKDVKNLADYIFNMEDININELAETIYKMSA